MFWNNKLIVGSKAQKNSRKKSKTGSITEMHRWPYFECSNVKYRTYIANMNWYCCCFCRFAFVVLVPKNLRQMCLIVLLVPHKLAYSGRSYWTVNQIKCCRICLVHVQPKKYDEVAPRRSKKSHKSLIFGFNWPIIAQCAVFRSM